MTPRRVIIVPRWSGGATDDWYPWIRARLAEDPGASVRVEVVELPNRDAPVIDRCIAALRSAIAAEPAELAELADLANTILVGHSVGCQALLRYLASLDPTSDDAAGPAHLVCVAGWWTVDEPWPSIRPWIETPIDLPRLRASTAGRVTVMLSDDDPFTADWRANESTWVQRLDAEVQLVAGARHFNAEREPAVLDRIRALL